MTVNAFMYTMVTDHQHDELVQISPGLCCRIPILV